MKKFLLIAAVLFSGVSFASIQGCEDKNVTGSDLKEAVRDSAQDVKEMGQDAAAGVKEMGNDTKRAVQDATD